MADFSEPFATSEARFKAENFADTSFLKVCVVIMLGEISKIQKSNDTPQEFLDKTKEVIRSIAAGVGNDGGNFDEAFAKKFKENIEITFEAIRIAGDER